MTKAEMIQAARDWDGRDVRNVRDLVQAVIDLTEVEADGDENEVIHLLKNDWPVEVFEALGSASEGRYPIDVSEADGPFVAIGTDGWALQVCSSTPHVRLVYVGEDEDGEDRGE